jgi:hypothetical protein
MKGFFTMIAEIKPTVLQNVLRQQTLKQKMEKLLPEEIRKQIPPLYSQDGSGGKAIAYAKLFTPSSSWTWYITEASPEGEDILCFGLVDGFEKELGYFSLAEMADVTGPLGLPIERDLYFKPTTLEKIAPELFRDH